MKKHPQFIMVDELRTRSWWEKLMTLDWRDTETVVVTKRFNRNKKSLQESDTSHSPEPDYSTSEEMLERLYPDVDKKD